jgi:crotonobetainyl-CoA:carnitine CoA-transferase CaiB-like acyl-CoA transferase
LLDPAYATNNDRAKVRETLIPLVASLLHQFTITELEQLCETAGLPFGRVNTPSDLVDDPHLNAGGMISLTLDNGDIAKVPALPIQFGSMRPGLRTPPPKAGEHNQEILGEIGRSPDNG